MECQSCALPWSTIDLATERDSDRSMTGVGWQSHARQLFFSGVACMYIINVQCVQSDAINHFMWVHGTQLTRARWRLLEQVHGESLISNPTNEMNGHNVLLCMYVYIYML
jgi:hypothetical protein